MTQIFREDGQVYPVTKIIAGPCYVIRKKEVEKDGYEAVQVAYAENKRANKPLKGLINKFLKKDIGYKVIKEFRLDKNDAMKDKLETGNIISAEIFAEGDVVEVKGVSKGKGFQGVVKRHGFSGSPASHGHKDQLRMPGSIGATGPARVFKGVRMGGHMGDQSVTVGGLEVVKVDPEKNEIFIKGALPGAKDGYLYITAEGEFEIKKVEAARKAESSDAAVEKKEEKVETQSVKAEKPEEKQEGLIGDNATEDKKDSIKEESKQNENKKEEKSNKEVKEEGSNEPVK